MKHFELTTEELTAWMAEEWTVYSGSSRERKRLLCSLRGTLRVTVAGEVVWQGTEPSAAVEAYNEITQQYVAPDFKR